MAHTHIEYKGRDFCTREFRAVLGMCMVRKEITKQALRSLDQISEAWANEFQGFAVGCLHVELNKLNGQQVEMLVKVIDCVLGQAQHTGELRGDEADELLAGTDYGKSTAPIPLDQVVDFLCNLRGLLIDY